MFRTISTIAAATLSFFVLSVVSVGAATFTYTEDFSDQTFFDAASSDDNVYWGDEAGLNFYATQDIPAPYYDTPTNGISWRVASSGQYVYGAWAPSTSSGELHVYDAVADSFSSVSMATWGVTRQIKEMQVQGNTLYMAWGSETGSQGGLVIVDISTPSSPALLRNFTIPGAEFVEVNSAGDYAFVVSNDAIGGNMVTIIDVPGQFTVGTVALGSGNYYDAHKWGDYLLVTSDDATPITAFDASTPSALTSVAVAGTFTLETITDLLVVGNDSLMVGSDASGNGVMELFSQVFSGGTITFTQEDSFDYSTETDGIPSRIASDGSDYFTTGLASNGTDSEVQAFEVNFATDTITDRDSAQYPYTYSADMAFYNDVLFAGNPVLGLVQVDVSDLTDIGTEIYTQSTSGDALDVAIYEDTLFVADGEITGNGTIQNLDVTDPTSISTGTPLTVSGCSMNIVEVVNDFLWFGCDDILGRFDIASPTAPTQDTVAVDIDRLAISGDVAYVLDSAGSDLYVYDVSGSSWSLETTISLPGTTGEDIAVADGYLYAVTTGSGRGLHVYDISTPESPSFVRTALTTEGSLLAVDVEGGYVFAVSNQLRSALVSELIDTSATPTVNSFNTSGSPERLTVENGLAYVGDNGAAAPSVQVVDVTDPTSMVLASEFDTELAAGFAVGDGWVHIADGSSGGIASIHMTTAVIGIIRSGEVDSTSDNIDSINYTFTAEDTADGEVSYYVSNNGGTSWKRLNSSSADTITGSWTFTTVGSDLRWQAVVEADGTVGFERAPEILTASIEYTTSAPADTLPPTTLATPASGVYLEPLVVTVEVSDDNPGSTIYYATDGSTPTTSSTVYTGPVTLTEGDYKFNYFAVDAAGNAESPTNSNEYAVTAFTDTVAPTSMADVEGSDGPFAGPINVVLEASDFVDASPTIYYTTDGSAPTTSSSTYTGPFNFTTTTTLNWFAVDASGNEETPTHSETYVINDGGDSDAPTVTAVPLGDTYASYASVVLVAADTVDPAPTIYFTTDGSTPTSSSFVYSYPIAFGLDTTIKFFAIDASGNASDIQTETYYIGTEDALLPSTPTIPEDDPAFVGDDTAPTAFAVPEDGTFDAAQTIGLFATDDLDPEPTIYYTTDGSDPSAFSFIYRRPLLINATTTIKFIAVDAAGNASPVFTETFTIALGAADSDAPEISSSSCSDGGFFDIAEEIELSATDARDRNPAIYYTTDGSTPTIFGFVYTGPIEINNTSTIKYFSRDASGNRSAVKEITCTVYDSSALSLNAKNKKTGVGNVRIVNKKTGKVLGRFRAFAKGGAKADIVKVRGVKRVAVTKFKKGKVVKLFDLNGNLLSKKKFAKKKQIVKLDAGNLFKGKANGEIMVTRLNKKKGTLVVRLFKVNTANKIKLRRTKKVTKNIDKLIAKGHRLRIKKKKLQIRTPKGSKVQAAFTVNRKSGSWRIKRKK